MKMSVGEVLKEVKKDRLLYRNSGGGITISGGEPLSQPEFALSLLQSCKEIGLHTCVDTCGFIPPHLLEEAIKYTDLFLFDLKHMDSATHQQITGVPNELVISNAKLIAAKGTPMIIRIALIAGLNDSEENIIATAAFAASLESVQQVDVLPYHRFGVSKYDLLGLPYSLTTLQSYSREDAEKARNIIINHSQLPCKIGG